jgi:hypothetical protein
MITSSENEVIEAINRFKITIEQFHNSIRNEAVWLFLATLGCLGVSNKMFQFIGLLVTVALFIYRATENLEDKRNFKTIAKDVRNDIDVKLDSNTDFAKARLYELQEIEKGLKISFFVFVKKFPILMLCWTYYVIVFTHSLQNIWS